ncbi:helix-turn-helix domain-containing protein [Bernardetia sp. OM2101]|uniref:helix-turn-helix domain-containing protein n=1 Tax=Bernardetia sp. OM2101 TaxID=3344876 RepID=UPI0035CF5756
MERKYVKRTQKDYTMQFKLQVVKEIEQGLFTVTQAQRNYGIQSRKTVVNWLDKYGNFDHSYKVIRPMKTAEQRLIEQEQEIRHLKKQNATLQEELSTLDKKAILFDMMIDLAEKEYKIQIRKNSKPK